MKTIIVLFCLIFSLSLNAQVLDKKDFNESHMNEVLFNSLNGYFLSNGKEILIHSSIVEKKIYRFLKKKNKKKSLDDIEGIINHKILKKYDTHDFRCVGLLYKMPIKKAKTYQEVAEKCIDEWKDNPSDAFFLNGWGTIVDVTTYYNRQSKYIFISLAYLPN